MIDEYQLEYISSRVLRNWLSQQCGCKLSDDDLALVLSRYDKDGDYRMSKYEFVQEIEAEEEPEQLDESKLERVEADEDDE